MTIDTLPDTVLRDIFDFSMDGFFSREWITLVHVCRNWRIIVLGSPRRLDLRLFCRDKIPVRKMLDGWPLFPIVVRDLDANLTALKYSDRICQIDLNYEIESWQWEEVLEAMQKPFPVLTGLKLSPTDQVAPVDPDLFLGGSAPGLRTLLLSDVPFPGLPKLLLSSDQLVYLDIFTPHSGYISPEAMVTGLSTLTRLKGLEIGFQDPQSRPDRNSQHSPPHARAHLPSLTRFWFHGVSDYLEDLVAWIDTPLLNDFTVSFVHQLIFSSPQLIQFINRTPRLQAHDRAHIVFEPDDEVYVSIPQTFGGKLFLQVISLSDQLFSLAQLCSSSFPRALISAVEHLYVVKGLVIGYSDYIEKNPVQWLEFLRPFTAVKRIYVSWDYTPHLIPALQKLVEERVTELLPTLQTVFLEDFVEDDPSFGPIQEAIGQFVAARQLVGQPIAFSLWNGHCLEEVYGNKMND